MHKYVIMPKNLLIGEPPAKAKTIEGYICKYLFVKSIYGNLRDLGNGDMAIDIDLSLIHI